MQKVLQSEVDVLHAYLHQTLQEGDAHLHGLLSVGLGLLSVQVSLGALPRKRAQTRRPSTCS